MYGNKAWALYEPVRQRYPVYSAEVYGPDDTLVQRINSPETSIMHGNKPRV